MKSRAYRRYMEEVIVLRRLNDFVRRNTYWYFYRDINGVNVSHMRVKDLIRSSHNFMFKTNTSDGSDTKNKMKYSQNCGSYYSSDRKTRGRDKKEFLKILKEYGIK